MRAMPSLANLVLWKTIYETNDRIYVDAVHILFSPVVLEGVSTRKIENLEDLNDSIPADSSLARDIERFRWFSDDRLFEPEGRPGVLADARYSMLPNKLDPLWGIVLNPKEPDKHVKFESFRNIESGTRRDVLEMLFAPRSGRFATSRDSL